MGAVPYTIGQVSDLTIGLPKPLVTIAGDNPTAFYLHFPALAPGQQWVFPYTYGFSFPLPAATPTINVTSRDTPPGFPTAPTDTTQASLVAYDYALPYSPGVRLATGSGWTAVGSKTLAAGSDTFTSLTVPPTSKTMAVAIEGAGNFVTNLQVVGATTGTVYQPGATQFSNGSRGLNIFPILGQLDSQYILSVSTGNGNTVALFASDQQQGGLAQNVASSSRSQPVVITFDQLSVTPWMAAQASAHAATGATLVAGVSGKAIYAFGCMCNVNAGAAGSTVQLQDSSSNTITEFPSVSVGTGFMDFHGAIIAGSAVGLKVVAVGGAPTAAITLAYTQV